MSHNNSDPTTTTTPLSQPLKVETEDVHHPESSTYYEQDKSDNFNRNNDNEDNDSLGPLPPKWEKAYTDSGEVYFIDHSTGTSHWLDPRLSKFQKKSLEDCLDDELPYGWEKISDPNYGTYFIDHVNRRTQYENPVIQAKRAASQASARASRTSFTKDPSELCGQRFRTSLVKSSRGLGFTIVGGDDAVDEFLQIKSVVPKGPAWLDGQLQTGDVIVYVNETCVLGYTHIQIVRLFQSINVGSTVSLEVCRGYPLPFDPNDPNTEVVTTIAVDSHLQSIVSPNDKRLVDTNYNFLDGDDAISTPRDEEDEEDDNTGGTSGGVGGGNVSSAEQATSDDIDDLLKGIGNCGLGKVEVHVRIVKGNLGFGFTIADSACGQRVKQILDRQRCKNLMEGDILLEINEISLTNMSHDEVVQVLKNCPYNSEATICVQRGCSNKTPNIRNKLRKLDNRFGLNNSLNSGGAIKDTLNAYRSKTPTADIYSTQQREVLPSRPKTPLVDTRCLSKTPIKDLNTNNELLYDNFSTSNSGVNGNNSDRSRLRLSLIDNQDIIDDDEIDLSDNHNDASLNRNKQLHHHHQQQQLLQQHYDYNTNHQNIVDAKYQWQIPAMPPHPYDCSCYMCINMRHDNSESSYDQSLKKNLEYWQYVTTPPPPLRNSDCLTMNVVLTRQETGFGFRIVGGIEDKSQVAVGHIVAGGSADMDGRIRSGDEIVSVDGFNVVKASHRQVVRLMNAAAARGQVNLIVQRRIYPQPATQMSGGGVNYGGGPTWPHHTTQIVTPQPLADNYDVTVQRSENEGFGFVIISSANKQGSTIGRLIEDSPAERCGRLRVGDHIVAVNHIAIMHLSHGDIVNLIKESGLSVTLTIAPNFDI